MEKGTSEFQYFLAANAPFLVVSFIGRIDKDCLGQLEEAQIKMESLENLKYIILYFREVPHISAEGISALTNMQRRIREKYQLRICSLKPDLKQKLVRLGVVRGLELTDNLQTTLMDLKFTS